jgi:hypothetical protein
MTQPITRNDGQPLCLSFYEAMLYTRLDRALLSFILINHLSLNAVERRSLAIETLDRATLIARRYPTGPPHKSQPVRPIHPRQIARRA